MNGNLSSSNGSSNGSNGVSNGTAVDYTKLNNGNDIEEEIQDEIRYTFPKSQEEVTQLILDYQELTNKSINERERYDRAHQQHEEMLQSQSIKEKDYSFPEYKDSFTDEKNQLKKYY